MSQTGLQGATRVMTWNIHGGVGPDRRCDLDPVIDVVRRHAPDVVALQEIDSRPSHTPGAFELLSEALGEHRVEARIIASGDGHYGHTLLSRWPVRSSRLHDLSFRMREPRAAIEATVATPGGALHIVATHLGLTRAERRHQAKRLGELADHDRSPTIMLGDFNDWWLGGHVRKALARRYPAQVRRRTFPARLPLLALDRLHCAAHVEVVRAWTDAAARSASDHLPLIADIILEPRQPTPS